MINDVLIEIYKKIKIWYNKDNGKLHGEDEKTNEYFEARYLFEIREQIDKPHWESYYAKGFIKSGYFNKELQIVESLQQNRRDKKPLWIVKEGTDTNYDIGKKVDPDVKVYPYTKERQKIFDEVVELENEIKNIENKQRELVKQL